MAPDFVFFSLRQIMSRPLLARESCNCSRPSPHSALPRESPRTPMLPPLTWMSGDTCRATASSFSPRMSSVPRAAGAIACQRDLFKGALAKPSRAPTPHNAAVGPGSPGPGFCVMCLEGSSRCKLPSQGSHSCDLCLHLPNEEARAGVAHPKSGPPCCL